MDSDNPTDLLFQTYYMIDWKTSNQVDAGTSCVSCGRTMKKVGPVRDLNGSLFDGLVCHACKSVFWVRRS